MVGGTIPPQSDSGEISRVLVLNLLWQSKRCSRTAQDISVLTTPSLLSRGTRPSRKRKRAGRVRAWLYRLRKKSESRRFAASGLKPSLILHDLRGAKAPLYHSAAGFRDFFRSLFSRAAPADQIDFAPSTPLRASF